MRAWMMVALITVSSLVLVGCNAKPDPKSQPGFKDTTDPSSVRMNMTPPGTPGMPAGAGAAGAGAAPGAEAGAGAGAAPTPPNK